MDARLLELPEDEAESVPEDELSSDFAHELSNTAMLTKRINQDVRLFILLLIQKMFKK